MICQSVVVKVASHVCKSWVSAPVVLLIELHVCKSGPSAPVAFHGCCPEQRQGPAQLRVLSNSPRAMSLFGLPIIVMTALYASRKQGKLQRACAYGGPEIHGCRSGPSAPVSFHGCCPEQRQGPAQLRVLSNSPRAMSLFGLPIIVMTALYASRKQGKLQRACAYGGPEIHGCRSGPSAPVSFHGCCPEQRQGPAQLRVLRNSPRAMPLFGLSIIVMTALYTSRKQGKLQRARAYGGPGIHGCRFGSFAPVIPLFHCYVCRFGSFAPVTTDDSGYSP